MARIFISYAREDKEIAKELEYRLTIRKQKHEVFRDVSGIPGGAIWQQALVDRAKWCQILLLLVSPDSTDSDFVYQEFREAEKNNKIIFPVVINDAEIPRHLSEYNVTYLRYVDDENNNLGEVILKIEDVNIPPDPHPQSSPKRKLPVMPILFVMGLLLIALVAFVVLSNEDEQGEETPTATIPAVSQLETEDASATENVPVASNPTNTNTPTSESIPIPPNTPEPTITPTLRPTNTNTPLPTDIPQSAILYEEDFEDDRANRLLSKPASENRFHIIDDGQNNKVLSGTGIIHLYIFGSKEWVNYAISLRFLTTDRFSGNSNFGILFRWIDNCRNYYLELRNSEHHLYKTILQSCDYAQLELGDTTPFNWQASPSEWHNVYIEVTGSAIRWKVGNSRFYEAIDSSHSSGEIGFLFWKLSSTVWIDDIKVWSLDESQ